MATFQDRLNEAMKLRNLKSADLVRITGIDKGSISCYLNGKYKASQDKLYQLARALDVDEA